MNKGLRLLHKASKKASEDFPLERRPDEQGIETVCIDDMLASPLALERRPDEQGIETR